MKKNKIITISLINNTPINSWWKMASFYVNNILSKYFCVNFYYFETRNHNVWLQPNTNIKKTNLMVNNIIKKVLSKLPSIISSLHLEFLFSKKLDNIKWDIILLEFPYLYPLAKKISNANNWIPIYLMEHNIEWKYFKQSWSFLWRLVKMYENFVINNVDKVLSISKWDAQYLQKHYPNKQIEEINMWVLSNIYIKTWKKIAYHDKKINFLYFWKMDVKQNIEWVKNIHKICKLLDQDTLKNIHFNIFGIWWDRNNPLWNHDNITYYWSVDNPSDWIRWSDYVLFPVFHSAWVKMRILESLYCGKKIITTEDMVAWLEDSLKKEIYVLPDLIHIAKKITSLVQNKEKNIKWVRYEVIKKYQNNLEAKLLKSFDLW